MHVIVHLTKGWVRWISFYNDVQRAYNDVIEQYPYYILCEIVEL